MALITAIFLFSGCSSKTSLSSEGFTAQLENKEFVITETESNAVITADNVKYKISFYYSEEAEVLPYAMDQIIKATSDRHSARTLSVSVSGSNYEYTYFNSGDTFFIVSRVDSTIMACTANKEYRNEILNVFEELRYK